MSKKWRRTRKAPAMCNGNASPVSSPANPGAGGPATPATATPVGAESPPTVAPTPPPTPAPAGGAGASGPSASPEAGETAVDKSVPAFLFALNFLVVGVVLTGVLTWLFFYTDWSEGLLTLLSLGGLLGGIATLFKAVSKKRIEETQDWVTRRIFDRHYTWQLALAVGVILLLVASCIGTIQVDHHTGNNAWLVRTTRAGKSLPAFDEAEQIAAGSRLRASYRMWPWQSTQVQIKVTGLPVQTQTIGAWSRKRVACPESFLRPIVLIGANKTVLLTEKRLTLVLKVDGAECYRGAYERKIVILGSGETDIAYPAGLASMEAWKEILTDVKLADQLRPAAALRVEKSLRPQQQVTAQLLDSDGKVYGESSLVTAQPTDVGGLVQDMMLIKR